MTASRRRDRYAARCVNLVLIATRIAVLGARSAPNTGTQPTVLRGYQGQSRWLGEMCVAAALVGAISIQGRASGTNDGQWRMYSADNAATKYSPLDRSTERTSER